MPPTEPGAAESRPEGSSGSGWPGKPAGLITLVGTIFVLLFTRGWSAREVAEVVLCMTPLLQTLVVYAIVAPSHRAAGTEHSGSGSPVAPGGPTAAGRQTGE